MPVVCQPGYYSATPGSVERSLCPEGYKCPLTYQSPVACAEVTYTLAGYTECLFCPEGYNRSSTDSMRCPPGWYSPEGVSS